MRQILMLVAVLAVAGCGGMEGGEACSERAYDVTFPATATVEWIPFDAAEPDTDYSVTTELIGTTGSPTNAPDACARADKGVDGVSLFLARAATVYPGNGGTLTYAVTVSRCPP